MSKFTGPLTLTHLEADDWRRWRLEEPLPYEIKETTKVIEVPKGFVTDGASIPRPLWWVLPTWGRYSRAAVVHDYLYSLLRSGSPHPLAETRTKADSVFRAAMRDCGVNILWRTILWIGVRVGGIFAT